MTQENANKLIVNALPLTGEERESFDKAACGIPQVFVGDEAMRGEMVWRANIPEQWRARASAVIGNFPASDAAQYTAIEWLQTVSAGVDAYTRPGGLPSDVMITNATGAYGQSVAEHMFAMMWTLMKQVHRYASAQRDHVWHDEGPAASPDGAVALIIGTGDIGSHFGRLAQAVGMQTIGVRRNASVGAEGIERMHGFEDLDALLPLADVVAMALPSTPQTHHLIDAARLTLLKPTAIVLNAGRGDAIDCQALAAALREGKLRAAGLDVTEPEPLPADHPLWDEPRCLITPHVAGGLHLAQTGRRIIEIALENVTRYAQGRELKNIVRR
ncbi:D-2-hydroxyacid dehydrogenase [Bifidobacterium oedipodis]|uniref:Dehydrogenase n=1 Tax=Bifidobacterium oedipodis TaxID=2675322 RepID=A0A7Y0EPE2_9BIFI|nr:D-2-hydroxyacid dehydrogenase [Bifidobacterium sp. DSM 109957]NMM92831.1 Dehydrogenase [Bifidobacterium sp. DSM 109957]